MKAEQTPVPFLLQDPEVLYASQLEQLAGMGFTNRAQNIAGQSLPSIPSKGHLSRSLFQLCAPPSAT